MERHFLERTPTDQGSERPAPTATDPDPDGDERRSALRKSLDQVPWITGVRISPGDPTQLINISPGGALVRSAVRLAPGSLKALMVFSTDKPVRASGRVVRCQVNSIARDGSVRYRTAICFDRELELDLNGENLDSDGAVARPEDPPAIANEGRAHAGVKGSFEATWNTPSGEQVVRVSHLNEDGCFVETPISVPLTDWVSLIVQLPDGDRCCLAGQVVRVDLQVGLVVSFLNQGVHRQRVLRQAQQAAPGVGRQHPDSDRSGVLNDW